MVKNYAYDYGKVSTVQSTVGYIPSIATTYSKKMGICYDIASLYAMLKTRVAAKLLPATVRPLIHCMHGMKFMMKMQKMVYYRYYFRYSLLCSRSKIFNEEKL